MKHSKKAQRAELLSKRQRAADKAKEARRQKRLERRKAQRAEQGAPSVLRPDAVDVAADRQPVGLGVARYGLRQLEGMPLKQQGSTKGLRETAKELGLKGYSKLRKDDLIEFIYRSDENLA